MAIPDAIAGAPTLREDLRWLWEAFSDLTTERSPGAMGSPPGHIPWRAMHAWCAANGLRGDDEAHFVGCIKAMDDAYLEHVCRKLKENTGGGTG
jgi:hypothetical protein